MIEINRSSRKTDTGFHSHKVLAAACTLTAVMTLSLPAGFLHAAGTKKKPAPKPAAKKTVPKPVPKTKPAPTSSNEPKSASTPSPTTKNDFVPYTEKLSGSLVTFDMAPIPAGEFTPFPDPKAAGGEASKPVKIKRFWMSKTEVTWDAYDVFSLILDHPGMTPGPKGKDVIVDGVSHPSLPYGAPDMGFGHTGYPAILISSYAAEQYCKWLTSKTGKKYRLPTPAEWEYAARAGSDSPGPTDKAELQKIAWVYENSNDKSHPVGKKPANAWGLYDMLGNVMEWTLDADGKFVARGGSWSDDAENVSIAARATYSPSWQLTDPQTPKSRWWYTDARFLGLRVVREE